jgi:hypothetical protein
MRFRQRPAAARYRECYGNPTYTISKAVDHQDYWSGQLVARQNDCINSK